MLRLRLCSGFVFGCDEEWVRHNSKDRDREMWDMMQVVMARGRAGQHKLGNEARRQAVEFARAHFPIEVRSYLASSLLFAASLLHVSPLVVPRERSLSALPRSIFKQCVHASLGKLFCLIASGIVVV